MQLYRNWNRPIITDSYLYTDFCVYLKHFYYVLYLY